MEWIPLNAPKPQDGKKYDIRLNDGSIVTDVEFWGHGGGFDPLAPGEHSPCGASLKVRYPFREVDAYKERG